MLSENSFERPIPESLSSLPNLTIILLGYNHLTGPIPDRLFQVSKFKLSCGLINTHPCTSGSVDASKKLNARLIIGVSAGVLVLLLLGCVILFMWRGRHKSYKRKVFADVAGMILLQY
uniref:Probable LRR receptor-like serine/threonine-protein kinase At5g10290 n=1 Tax=Tanacetum cinerariifolium TaxID=118510 RepID=A0A6L2NZ98_TANCI|nr:probable LRR receptor-like serine/threonine-protein kinase At5g10290 [Tanacetum cinerariifolium]